MEEEAKTLVIHCGCMTPQSKRLHDFSVRKPSAFKHVIIWVRVGLYPVPLTMPMKIGSRQEEEWEGHYTPGSLHDTPVHTSLKTFVVIPRQSGYELQNHVHFSPSQKLDVISQLFEVVSPVRRLQRPVVCALHPDLYHPNPRSSQQFCKFPIQKLRLDLRMYYTSVAVVLCNETKYPLGPLLIQIKSRVHQKQHLYAGRKDKP